MTGKLLPTDRSCDTIELRPGTSNADSVRVSMVDAANPFVFVLASDLGLHGNEKPAELVQHTGTLMDIRCLAAVMMGLAPDVATAALTAGTPKIALIGSKASYVTTAGRELAPNDMDLHVRAFSMGAPHPSLQMTGAVCLAAACAIPGSIPNMVVAAARSSAASRTDQPLRFAHGSGIIETESVIRVESNGTIIVQSGSVYRTARRLFEGKVSYLTAAAPHEARGMEYLPEVSSKLSLS